MANWYVVRGSVWRKREGSGTIGFSSAGEASLDQGEKVAVAHEQTDQVLGLSLAILVPDAQASKPEERRIGDGSFCVKRVKGGKIEMMVMMM